MIREAPFVREHGPKLYLRWLHAEEGAAGPRALLLIVHGYGEHGGRYRRLMRNLAGHGISTCAVDCRGFGASSGRSADVVDVDEYLQDIEDALGAARSRLGVNLPPFVLGHSQGGLLAMRFAQQCPETALAGLVVSSPAIAFARLPWTANLAKVLARLPWVNRWAFRSGVDFGALTHDRQVMEELAQDPLVVHTATARWLVAMQAAQRAVVTGADRIRIPFLMQLAGDDRIVLSEVSHLCFEDVGSSDKSLREYDRAYHELYQELPAFGGEQAVSDLVAWIAARS